MSDAADNIAIHFRSLYNTNCVHKCNGHEGGGVRGPWGKWGHHEWGGGGRTWPAQ
jgi:hypothetical protein